MTATPTQPERNVDSDADDEVGTPEEQAQDRESQMEETGEENAA